MQRVPVGQVWEPARSEAMDAQVAVSGRAVGLDFNYPLVAHSGHSRGPTACLDAQQKAGVSALVESIFPAYSSLGENVGDIAVKSSPPSLVIVVRDSRRRRAYAEWLEIENVICLFGFSTYLALTACAFMKFKVDVVDISRLESKEFST